MITFEEKSQRLCITQNHSKKYWGMVAWSIGRHTLNREVACSNMGKFAKKKYPTLHVSFARDTEPYAFVRLCLVVYVIGSKKVCFYIAHVSSPLDHSNRFTLFLLSQTCSFRHQLGFSWKHSSHAAITREDHSLIFPQPSIARYSFIQLSELGCHVENENAQTLKLAKGDSNPGSLDCKSGILPQ